MAKQVSPVHNVMIRISRPDSCSKELWYAETSQKIIQSMFKSFSKNYIYQYEFTKSHQYDENNEEIPDSERDNDHIQGFSKLERKQRPSALAKIIRTELEILMKDFSISVQPAHDTNALSKYSMKSDTRVNNLVFSDHAIYLGVDLPKLENLYPYQKDLYQMCLSKPDDRLIYWIYDKIGNTGKSKFCKFMSYHIKTPKLDYGKTSDILNLVSKYPNSNAYLFNLTRAKPMQIGEQDLYSTLESCKDGHFCNTKYNTEMVLQNPAHIIVFANHYPQINLMSLDRWRIMTITEEKKLVPYQKKEEEEEEVKKDFTPKLDYEQLRDIRMQKERLEKYTSVSLLDRLANLKN